MPNRKRDSEGRFASGSFVDAMRDRPSMKHRPVRRLSRFDT